MIEPKTITTIEQFKNEITLKESHDIYTMVNKVAFSIAASDESALIELDQAIVKDVYTEAGNRGFHVIATFTKHKNIKFMGKIAIDVDIGVSPEQPLKIYDNIDDMNLEMNTKTINKRLYAQQ